MAHQVTNQELVTQKVEVILASSDSKSDSKSLVMRIDMKTNVVTYAVAKVGTPVQLFNNFGAAFGCYHK